MALHNGGERERTERSDKRIRVNATLTKIQNEKLDRLGVACGITKTSLAAELIDLCLNNEQIIDFIQRKHANDSRFRIIPTKHDGELKFIFAEKLVKK